jgi:hypothetical protein
MKLLKEIVKFIGEVIFATAMLLAVMATGGNIATLSHGGIPIIAVLCLVIVFIFISLEKLSHWYQNR